MIAAQGDGGGSAAQCGYIGGGGGSGMESYTPSASLDPSTAGASNATSSNGYFPAGPGSGSSYHPTPSPADSGVMSPMTPMSGYAASSASTSVSVSGLST